MEQFLGIDMGGSATRWVSVDAGGRELARGVAPGASALMPDTPAREAFLAALAACARPGARRAHLGLTGMGHTADPALLAACAGALGLRALTVEPDIALARRAAFGAGAGTLVLAGTGSVAMGLGRDGAALILGGRGALIDDAGSAAWIALRALAAYFRQIDETGTAPPVLAWSLAEATGGEDWGHLCSWVHAAPRGQLGLLARAVARAAGAGCALSLDVLESAAGELVRLARVAARRSVPAPLAVAGGVLRLHPLIAERLRRDLAPLGAALVQIDPALSAARHAAGVPDPITATPL
jgi:glucosamine kinase